MQRRVQPHVFFLFGNFHRGEGVDHRQHHVGKKESVERRAEYREALDNEEMRSAGQQSVRAGGIHCFGSEDSEQNFR